MKSFDFEAVTYDGAVYCVECFDKGTAVPEGYEHQKVKIDDMEVSPIFADSEWDSYPVCDVCHHVHDYVSLTAEGQRAAFERDLSDPFVQAYISCALWSSTDDDGDPLDGSYDASDVAEDTLREMIDDCKNFREANAELLEGSDDTRAGHDFWLTRNGHGAGFWARGVGVYPNDPHGRKLTEASKAWGSFDLCVGDDGKVYGS